MTTDDLDQYDMTDVPRDVIETAAEVADAERRRDRSNPGSTSTGATIPPFDPYDDDLDWLADLMAEGEDIPTPTDRESAERMLRLRQRRLAEIVQINADFEPEIDMLEGRRRDLLAGPTREVSNLTEALTEFARHERDVNKVKKLDLPHGRLQTRAGRESIVIDEDAIDRIIEWARLYEGEILDHQPESWRVSKTRIRTLVKTGTAAFDVRRDIDIDSGEVLGETPVLVFHVPVDEEGKGADLQIDGIELVTSDVGVTITDATTEEVKP